MRMSESSVAYPIGCRDIRAIWKCSRAELLPPRARTRSIWATNWPADLAKEIHAMRCGFLTNCTLGAFINRDAADTRPFEPVPNDFVEEA